MITQAIIDKSKKNIIVRVIFNHKKIEHECVGVISKIDSKKVQIIFNALRGIAIDYIDIPRKSVTDVQKVYEVKLYR